MGFAMVFAWAYSVFSVAALNTHGGTLTQQQLANRRRLLGQFVASTTLSSFTPVWLPPVVDAKETSRLKTGYDGIVYLLNNWDKETIKSCPQGQVTLAAECERNADKVPTALGLRSTTAPLYKIEKLFTEALQSGDVDDIDAWTSATDLYIQHSTSAQEYAYTASFGEYNPSGGKDQVAKYMELSRNELVMARDALKDVLLQLGYEAATL
ncbi:hypothetical protein CTAYLR_007842 [Chrysophaeum taylorii]|uniref:Uncharacterized protein n=1 Tax=Chrysophaeum taylorii TaxID=2483200 RepID=A0AAD7XM61_9STRA|nr:hypothetical protein CTAYLR_007842 [Chrysophaeum taylorii]